MADEEKQRSLFRNIISWIGMLIALMALGHILILVILESTQGHSNPYLGILAYMVIPAIMVIGLLIFFFGAWWERRRRHKREFQQLPPYPRIDLNNPRHRGWLAFAVVAGTVFILISTVGSYKAYHYTDSDAFCGLTCHEVMHPEYTAYQASPHARVGCVGCHVGPGAGWYVRSKLSGAYQVYSVLFEKFPRPIETPVENLRPAQETCEQCHWPEKFWGAQLKTFNHYGYDEANTPRETRMLIKTGGGSPRSGVSAGIHWHMNIANEVTYVSEDRKREKIAWVQLRDRNTGKTSIYKSTTTEMTPQQIAAAPKRTMDCIDCHNRPTHIYVPPDRSVDRALLAGRIDSTLPFVKAQTVAALTKEYPTTPAAVAGIDRHLREFYQANHAEVATAKAKSIQNAIATAQQIYRTTIFPEMKVDWRTHPDHIGHFYSTGCFRCHDGTHVNDQGKPISKDCDICHTVISQAESGALMTSLPKTSFVHPVELGDLAEYNCADCHTGGAME
jgi:nitrate/TMAO reductase-like tetraheme cytochrome c subunit